MAGKMTLTDRGVTDWTMECVTDAAGSGPGVGGIVLQDVRHADHNFAKDIRVIGLWVEVETLDTAGTVTSTTKKFSLLTEAPFTAGKLQILKPVPFTPPKPAAAFNYLKEADDALEFSTYFKDGVNYVGYGVKVEYDAPAFFAAFANCEMAGLKVTQVFLFSRYSNVPAHEPSGTLYAARCFPMISYEMAPNTAVDKTKATARVSSIRFDYRLHLFLDRHEDVATNKTQAQLGNNAGLFKDQESIAKGAAFGSGLKGLMPGRTVKSGAATAAVFAAAEKPVVLEVVARGLTKGIDRYQETIGGSVVDLDSWDNIHWWGTRGGGVVISAPGAFHAAHLHWRWGAATGGAPFGKDPQFQGKGWSSPTGLSAHPSVAGRGSPLVDPGIWIQTLRVATVKNEPSLDPAKGVDPKKLTRDDWQTLFTGLRASPDDISAGADIVLWFSIEVHRATTTPPWVEKGFFKDTTHPAASYTTSPKGIVFIHGIFFGHEAEQKGWTIGTTTPEYWPTSEATIRSGKKWFRSP